MSHLTPEEFVDAVDGTLSRLRENRRRHLEGCVSCREEVASLGVVMRDTRALDIPEPSPLFWDHLARRVREGVSRDADAGAVRGTGGRGLAAWWRQFAPQLVAVGLAVTVGVAGWGWLRSDGGASTPRGPERPVAAGAADRANLAEARGAAPLMTDEPEWALLLDMVDAVEWTDGDTDLLMLDHGAIDGVMFQLSADERRALAALLEAELGGASRL